MTSLALPSPTTKAHRPAAAGADATEGKRYDVWRGNYVLLQYGLPAEERGEYNRLLRDRYGIQPRAVAFCIVSPALRAYVDAYDEVSGAAVTRKFGRDVYEECWEEAQKEFAAKRAAQDVAN